MKTIELNLFDKVNKELKNQLEKWGEQNHPSVDVRLLKRSVERMTEEYEIASENRAKQLTSIAEKRGSLTWAHIAVEELSESISARLPEDRSQEIVQLIAVLCNWYESIQKNES